MTVIQEIVDKWLIQEIVNNWLQGLVTAEDAMREIAMVTTVAAIATEGAK